MNVDLLNKRPFRINAPPFFLTVNFNGEVSNKRPSRISHAKGERNDACYENAIFISNGSFVFLKTSLKMAISLSVLAACRITLTIFPDSLRAT